MDLSEKVSKLISEITAKRLIDKDLKPVVVVSRIIEEGQILFEVEKDKDFLQIVQETYIKLLVNQGAEPIKARQSWVVASGGNFEGYIREHINEVLNSKGIIAIKGTLLQKLAKKSEKAKELVRFLTLQAKRKCIQTGVDVWPDNDVLVLGKTNSNQWRVLASISVKTSSHSRNTSVLFWAMAVTGLGIKYYLATQDRDNQFVKDCTSENVNQERRLFEAYCDRVFTTNPNASYCAQVKSLILRDNGSSELTDELLDLRNREILNAENFAVSIDDLESY